MSARVTQGIILMLPERERTVRVRRARGIITSTRTRAGKMHVRPVMTAIRQRLLILQHVLAKPDMEISRAVLAQCVVRALTTQQEKLLCAKAAQ